MNTTTTITIDTFREACNNLAEAVNRQLFEGFRREIRHQAEAVMVTFQARMSETYGLLEYHPEREVKFYFETHELG